MQVLLAFFDGLLAGFFLLFTGVRFVRQPLPKRNKKLRWKQGTTMGTLDWSKCPAVESIPGKVSGAWVLKGTRMPVAAIFENLEAGANIDDILEWFDGIDREQVKAVIKFAARSLDKAPEYARAS